MKCAFDQNKICIEYNLLPANQQKEFAQVVCSYYTDEEEEPQEWFKHGTKPPKLQRCKNLPPHKKAGFIQVTNINGRLQE